MTDTGLLQAKEELGQDGLETAEEEKQNRQAIKQLTQTIDDLINKLDKTEKGLYLFYSHYLYYTIL